MNTFMKKEESNKTIENNFIKCFNHSPLGTYHIPGRSELGGNHTDHQNGQVLAGAVDVYITASVSQAGCDGDMDARRVEIHSEGYGKLELSIDDLTPRQEEVGTTTALVRGVLKEISERGFKIGGFKAYISSDIPTGSGLSSSAAFEILIGKIQSELYNNGSISYVELAQIGQQAENKYFGKPCGLMDQLACASETVLYIDFAYDGCPVVEEIDFDFESCGYSLCITNTGESHANLTDQYAAITDEMKAVAEIFGQEKLRGITAEELIDRATEIRNKAGDRAFLRAMHFVSETVRARKQADALKDGDFQEFLRLVKSSGDSSYKLLQNIYAEDANQAVSVGLAVSEAVLGEDGVCRVHGGGFGGTIQAFVKSTAVDRYREAMDKLFGDNSCRVLNLLGSKK